MMIDKAIFNKTITTVKPLLNSSKKFCRHMKEIKANSFVMSEDGDALFEVI